MMVVAYEYISKVVSPHIRRILQVFNQTAAYVCEGQQLDMDFESREQVTMGDYLHMIGLKTSVLLAASLQLGSILGGAGLATRTRSISSERTRAGFPDPDDYLDCYGDAVNSGRRSARYRCQQKTFLLIKAMEVATDAQRRQIKALETAASEEKIAGMLRLFHDCGWMPGCGS